MLMTFSSKDGAIIHPQSGYVKYNNWINIQFFIDLRLCFGYPWRASPLRENEAESKGSRSITGRFGRFRSLSSFISELLRGFLIALIIQQFFNNFSQLTLNYDVEIRQENVVIEVYQIQVGDGSSVTINR